MRWYGIKEGVMVYKPDSVVGTHHSGDEEGKFSKHDDESGIH